MKTISFNKHAFVFYKAKMKSAGFPVEKYSDKQLKLLMTEFVTQLNKVTGFYTDDEREQIVASNMVRDIRNRKIEDLLS